MSEFNLRKLKETFAAEIKKKTSTIFKLEVEISKLKFSLAKQKPKLGIKKDVNHEIPQGETILKPNPSLQQLSKSLTSNTCDTASQFYHDLI